MRARDSTCGTDGISELLRSQLDCLGPDGRSGGDLVVVLCGPPVRCCSSGVWSGSFVNLEGGAERQRQRAGSRDAERQRGSGQQPVSLPGSVSTTRSGLLKTGVVVQS